VIKKKETLFFIKTLLAYIFIRLLAFTFRFNYLNKDLLDKTKSEHGNYIFSLWHQNLIGAIISQMGNPHAMIVSASLDGDIVAKPCEWLGHKTARGSSSKKGMKALKQMITYLRNGFPGAITVDGPRGPRHEPKPGVFELAYLARTPIVPLTVIPRKQYVAIKAWDHFRVPYPFTKFDIHFGQPIVVKKEDKEDGFTRLISDLTQQMKQSEEMISEKFHENQLIT
jgi:lysophospholipid acyltransferase (LPLAT)-like uncharacterized protein